MSHAPGCRVAADVLVLVSGWFPAGVVSADTASAGVGGAVSVLPTAAGGTPRAGLGAKLADPGAGRPAGALIVDVTAGSPARRGGLAPGDLVVGFGGWRVSRASDLEAAVNAIERDGFVMMRLQRNGIEMELALFLRHHLHCRPKRLGISRLSRSPNKNNINQ